MRRLPRSPNGFRWTPGQCCWRSRWPRSSARASSSTSPGDLLQWAGLQVGSCWNFPQIGALANLSRWAFLLMFAGVGLRTNFKALSEAGTEAIPCWCHRRNCNRRLHTGPRPCRAARLWLVIATLLPDSSGSPPFLGMPTCPQAYDGPARSGRLLCLFVCVS